jgi:hypothetical protein
MVCPVTIAAKAAIDNYRLLLGRALGQAIEGIYLTGSAALGDWLPGRSELDILTVTNRRLDQADLDALAALHEAAPERPYLDAIYVYRGDVGRRAVPGSQGVPHAIDGAFSRDGYLFDPVLWATLDRHGLTIEGTQAAELGAAPDPAWLRDWNLGNLDSYWRPWAADARIRLADRDKDAPLRAEVVVHALLGPGRLHYTIATGRLLAKTAAAGYTARLLPGHADLLGRAKSWRLGHDLVQFTVPDGLAACDLIDAVADDALTL